MSEVVIIGNGPAAQRLASCLAQHGFAGSVTVIGAEHHPAYNRAMLPFVLDGSLSPAAIALPAPPAATRVYEGVTAVAVDHALRTVHTDDGAAHRYDRLVLATGARPRIPPISGLLGPGAQLREGVTSLRTLDDCARIGPGNVVILGAGASGVEAALAFRRDGRAVTLVDRGEPMAGRLGPEGAGALTTRLVAAGVEVQTGRSAVAYTTGKLVLDDGQTLRADALVLCTGVTPESDLAAAAGLTVQDGVVVDDRLRTSVPAIHAIGDCAEPPGGPAGTVISAWEQAESLARQLMGTAELYRPAKSILRVKSPGADTACFGSLPEDGVTAESVTLSAPDTGRYAKLFLCEQRITGAVIVGLPKAIATVSQLYDSSLPVPSDRLALLLGTSRYTGHPQLSDDAVVCHCSNVTKADLLRACRDGAPELTRIVDVTRATSGCGGCVKAVRAVCASAEPSPAHHAAGRKEQG